MTGVPLNDDKGTNKNDVIIGRSTGHLRTFSNLSSPKGAKLKFVIIGPAAA